MALAGLISKPRRIELAAWLAVNSRVLHTITEGIAALLARAELQPSDVLGGVGLQSRQNFVTAALVERGVERHSLRGSPKVNVLHAPLEEQEAPPLIDAPKVEGAHRHAQRAVRAAFYRAELEVAAALVKSLDRNHPVVSSYGEIDFGGPGSGTDLAATRDYVTNVCPSVDVWSLNIYRGDTFGRIFQQWASLSTKPMFLGEFGVDVFHATALTNSAPGAVNEAKQAQWDLSLWRDIRRNLSAPDAGKVALGGAVFSWSDEWWKVSPPGSQQTNGWFSGGFPDGMGNEEHFGVTDIDRRPRQVYEILRTAFDPAYSPPPQNVPFSAVSKGGCGYAEFYKGAAKIYRDIGCKLNGARGFNVAVINTQTGELHQPIKNFDTWYTRGSGEGMYAMIDFLNSLPNGVLIMIAVADEAGLTFNQSCSHLSAPWIEQGMKALEALGSTQIRNYCYWDSFAMIAFKGEGVARGEQLGKGVHASAVETLSLP